MELNEDQEIPHNLSNSKIKYYNIQLWY
jgi:hypothetical protein